MSEQVSEGMGKFERLLLIDTCGEAAAVALACGAGIARVEDLPERSASARIIAAVRQMLDAEGWSLAKLDGVGVASGPGSFTGVRTGLAAAKGLCEACGLPLAAISRLAVLAEVAELSEGFAALDAGRSSLYVRELRAGAAAHEYLASIEEFKERAVGAAVVVAEEKVSELLAALEPRLRPLHVMDLLEPVRRCLAEGGTDVAWADANYVLPEGGIYKRPQRGAKAAAQ